MEGGLMALMRDKYTGVVRDVPAQTLARWPEDYEPVTKTAEPPAEGEPVKTATAEPKKAAGGTKKGIHHGKN